ncbi:hypothetical protein ACFSCX_03835 [Bacillus salitolerans]|uniref:Uncharacterized protein n=1 Tax=Bacillus salitolerans TaxID=1437434 RepID=A0ABW4LNS7_9BACI
MILVTAIVIPLIFFYFLHLTIENRKKRHEEWLRLAEVKELAVIAGEVKQSLSKIERFAFDYKIVVERYVLKGSKQSFKAIRRIPITSDSIPPTIKEGEQITCYGYWEKDTFIFNRYTARS